LEPRSLDLDARLRSGGGLDGVTAKPIHAWDGSHLKNRSVIPRARSNFDRHGQHRAPPSCISQSRRSSDACSCASDLARTTLQEQRLLQVLEFGMPCWCSGGQGRLQPQPQLEQASSPRLGRTLANVVLEPGGFEVRLQSLLRRAPGDFGPVLPLAPLTSLSESGLVGEKVPGNTQRLGW
jgi:hypothetical protein